MKLKFVMPLLAASALIPASAVAGGSFDSHVSIKLGPTTNTPTYLYGGVGSSKAPCERDRKLKLIRDDRLNGGEVTVYGHTTSDTDGKWRYDPPAPPIPNGYYHAVAPRKKIPAGACKRARSEKVFVD